MSIGKALNFIGQIKVIRVAIAYTRLSTLSNHIPSNFVSTECVSNSFRLIISTSGSHKLLRICKLTAVNLSSGSLVFTPSVINGCDRNHHLKTLS